MTSSMYSPWLRALVLFAITIIVFWPTLVQMESVWRHSETYMHCYFIVPMALYMVWIQRDSLQGMKPQPALLPVLLLIPLSLLWLSAYAIDVGFVSHISQVVVFQLLLWHMLGHQIARKLIYPLVFLIFLAPFGESLTPALQEITADIGVALLRMADIPVYRDGFYLHTTVTVFEVADACSGLNFLISSAVISLLFAYMYFQKLYKQIIFVILTLLLSILANGLRAFLLMFVGEKTNMAWGFGDDHYYYGWAVFAITMLISFRIGEHFADPVTNNNPTGSTCSAPLNTTYVSSSLTTSIVAFVIIASFYPLRSALPQTTQPEEKDQVFAATDFFELDHNQLGTSFTDGIRRSHLQNRSGVEMFGADFAVRQQSGDLITWHNWLFDEKKWSVIQRVKKGSSNQNVEFVQLTSSDGRTYTLLYWYQIDDVRSSNKIFIKLLQLKAILLHEPVALGVRMLAVRGHDFEAGQQLLQTVLTNNPALTEAPQPLNE